MKRDKALALLLTMILMFTSLFTSVAHALTTSSTISIELDKTTGNVGDIITATIKINNMSNFGGYQLNIKYDPTALQAVNPDTGAAFGTTTMPIGATVMVNDEYGPTFAASNSVQQGILNFGRAYTFRDDYRNNGVAEENGIIGKIGFKVLKAENTTIKFEETPTMPDSVEGTFMFDWYGKPMSGYSIIQPTPITAYVEPTVEPTPTEVTPEPTPTVVSPLPTDAYVAMELDKTEVSVGEMITATIAINNMSNFGGYQVNIKYDPTVLQAVNPDTGAVFGTRSMPIGGTVMVNAEYVPTSAVANDVQQGILNFGRSYTARDDYRNSGAAEENGIIGKIGFKVLKAENTTIKFEQAPAMPNSIEGTYMFDWYGTTRSGYSVIQPAQIIASVEPTPTAATPLPTATVVTPLPTDAYVAMELDKTEVLVEEIITATIAINNMSNFGGYQVNIKYDPAVLQAINPDTGAAFGTSTMPIGGTVMMNAEYSPTFAASNDVQQGILNFGRTYTARDDYRNSGAAEQSGLIGKISFKVLKAQNTTIKFEEAPAMPDSIEGTYMFDWYGTTMSGYNVIQPDAITAVSPTPTPTPTTPTPTPTTTPVAPIGGGDPPVLPSPTLTPSPTPTEIEVPNTEMPAVGGEHISYLKGYPDGFFRPEKSITRAEAAVIFAKLFGANENTEAYYNISYKDLDDSHWAAWAIKFVSHEELFKGYPDGSFKPNQNITRAEFSTVVFKVLEIKKGLQEEELKEYKFEDSKGHWARQYIEQLSSLGYIKGYSDGTFKPDEKIKRSESVALINRALERGPLHGAEQQFPDVPETHWAFEDIAEGVLNHKFEIDSKKREILIEILIEILDD